MGLLLPVPIPLGWAYVVPPMNSTGVITSRLLSSKKERRSLLVGGVSDCKARPGGLTIPLSAESLILGKRTRLIIDQTGGRIFRNTSLYRLKGYRAFTWQ
jgi:hypothetical protein